MGDSVNAARQTADPCSLLQAHEEEGCSFPANITDRANLTVAGQALTALDGSNLFGSHGTVFLPNDAAFTALLTALGELPCTQTPARVAAPPAGLLARTFVSDQVVIPHSETVPGDAGQQQLTVSGGQQSNILLRLCLSAVIRADRKWVVTCWRCAAMQM